MTDPTPEMPLRIWAYRYTGRNDGAWRCYQDGLSEAEYIRADAARELLDNLQHSYRARNGREVGIEADDGEKMYIIHSDSVDLLRSALGEGET